MQLCWQDTQKQNPPASSKGVIHVENVSDWREFLFIKLLIKNNEIFSVCHIVVYNVFVCGNI